MSAAGFRCSLADVGFLALAAVGTWFAVPVIGEWAVLLPFVVGHFFLFCNVFRVGTPRELTWVGFFLGNFLLCMQRDPSDPLWLILAQAPYSLAIIFHAVCDRRYHGIGS